jgi:hypothetical protein
VHQTKSNPKPRPPAVDLGEMVRLFYDSPQQLADFSAISDGQELGEPYRGLLDHEAHMTVTVEAFHGCPVDVHVERTKFGEDHNMSRAPALNRWYAREITLLRTSDHRPVQYGIVRLRYELLGPDVWDEIRGEGIPLGRALIEHGVLREVELCDLWRVTAAKPLAKMLGIDVGTIVYGRTARIFCDYLPAIELLEIVVP